MSLCFRVFVFVPRSAACGRARQKLPGRCRARTCSKRLERLPPCKLALLRTQSGAHSPTPLPLGTLRDGGQTRQVGGHIGRCGETGRESAAKEDPEG